MCNPPSKPHTTCEYCDANAVIHFFCKSFYQKDFQLFQNACVPGCPDDSLCPSNYPICGHGGGPHLCGCSADKDCAEDELCDTNSHECFPKPVTGCDNNNANCPSQVCDEPWPYTSCQWCDGTVCKPGIINHTLYVSLSDLCVKAVLMMGSVQRTNQSVELVDNLTGVAAMLTLTARLVTSVVTMSASLLSALEMLTARMVSVMSTTLLTILSVSIVRLATVFQVGRF